MSKRPIRTLGPHKVQADYSDRRRGIPRVKRTFTGPNCRKEAREWVAAMESDAHRRLLGHRPQHLFGQALAQFISQQGHTEARRAELRKITRLLRWPVADGKRWLRLEQTALQDIIPGFNAWLADVRGIQRRRELDGQQYHLRAEGWYHQPEPDQGTEPPERVRVTDPRLIAQLQAQPGRGPYANQSLRLRQILVREILTAAWRDWEWLEQDLSGKIKLLTLPPGKESFFLPEQVQVLASQADARGDGWLSRAIRGASWIGWRLANLRNLTWANVVWPERDATGQPQRPGLIWAEAAEVKNGKALALPLSPRLEALLKECWEHRRGAWVFHKNGQQLPYHQMARTLQRHAKRCGIEGNYTWHSLRHTFATTHAMDGATDLEIQRGGGWSSLAMVKRYTHLNTEHLSGLVNAYQRKPAVVPPLPQAGIQQLEG